MESAPWARPDGLRTRTLPGTAAQGQAESVADESQPPATAEEFLALLARRDVTSVFQPLVHLDTGEVVGFEALARGPVGTNLAQPSVLFAQAEATDRVAELDWVCLAAAFRGFLDAGAPTGMSLFVNLSMGLHLDRCPPDLLGAIGRAEASARVFVEVNDRALAADPSGVLAMVDRARELGWGISVDDVGTSLGCLSVLPMVRTDVVKLDMRLLGGGSGGGLSPVVAPLLRHVEVTGATLVVKGIESEADLRLAQALGASYGQGYHLGAPRDLVGILSNPRAVVPLLGGWRGAPDVDCPYDVVADHSSQRMTGELMREVGAFFAERALSSGSRPVVLVGMADNVATELEREAQTGALARLAERAVLLAAFGKGLGPAPVPRVRGVDLPTHDPLARQPFCVILTESLAFAMVAVHPVGVDHFLDVVVTQDPVAVDMIAEHLIRRIPFGDRHEVLPLPARVRRPAEVDPEPEVARRAAPRVRWGHRRA